MPQTLTKTGIGRPFSVTTTLDSMGEITLSMDYTVLTAEGETISRSMTRGPLTGTAKTRAGNAVNDAIGLAENVEGIP